MAQEQARLLLQKGIQAARSNRPDVARQLLQQAVQLEPRNETIWLWLSSVARTKDERVFCLRKLLEINPQNDNARKGLQSLGIEISDNQPVSTASSAAPMLSEEKLEAIQPALDNLIRSHRISAPPRPGPEWMHKGRMRYGERGAQRLRRTMMATAVIGFVLLIGLIAVALVSLGVFEGDEGDSVAGLFTRVPTLTATLTLTPTPGGATPTDFPAQMAIEATQQPVGLGDPRNPYGLKTPTEIYPRVDVDVARIVRDAVDYFVIGDYEEVIDQLAMERERSAPDCYPQLVYYEALSYAEQGNLLQAERLVTDLLNEPAERGRSSCENHPVLKTALAEIAYQRGDLEDALAWSGQALADDPKLRQAALIKGQTELARGDTQAAWLTVNQTLREWPEDANLLILLAEIELAADQLENALEYVGQGLYLEPTHQAGLRTQARIYLELAQGAEPGSERALQYYGLAVRSAQTLQLFHASDPAGYLYLAQARIGEGNDSLAETTLNRVLASVDELPDEHLPIVRDVYQTRGLLYYAQGRYELAQPDLEWVASEANAPPAVLECLVEITMARQDFDEALRWLDQLMLQDISNPAYQLWRARLLVEACTYYTDAAIPCAYEDMQALLTDEFIARLGSEDARADAHSYRAQARYYQIADRQAAPDDDRMAALQAILDDLEFALQQRESPVDQYVRGLVYVKQGDLTGALDAFRWVAYWDELYNYPFVDDELAEAIQDLAATITAQYGAATATQEALEVTPTLTPSPTIVTSTPTPTLTITPTPTPTTAPTRTPDLSSALP